MPLPFTKRKQFVVFLSQFVLFIILGCYHLSSSKHRKTDELIVETEAIQVTIDTTKHRYNQLRAGTTTYAFYHAHEFQPFWFSQPQVTPLVRSMVSLLHDASYYGLMRKDYDYDHLQQLIAPERCVEPEQLGEYDILLTNAFFSFVQHLKNGRVAPDSLNRMKNNAFADSLQHVLLKLAHLKNDVREVIEEQKPSYALYHEMERTLSSVIAEADSSERQRIMIGERDLNSPLMQRLITLEVNMERMRWETKIKDRFILVNIPSYQLTVVQNDSTIFKTRVIVGTRKTQTPQLDGLIRSITFFPTWNVPRNIAVEEMLPKIKTDSAYLSNHNYSLMDNRGNVVDSKQIEWKNYHTNYFPFTIQQREGVNNALGVVKFNFNNSYDVYLHDTNARPLFNKEFRSLSHGCVRVDKPLDMAKLLMTNTAPMKATSMDRILKLGVTQTVRVPEPIPVHIRYFTCDLTEAGLAFFPDVYGEDKKMMKLLYPALGENIIASVNK